MREICTIFEGESKKSAKEFGHSTYMREDEGSVSSCLRSNPNISGMIVEHSGLNIPEILE